MRGCRDRSSSAASGSFRSDAEQGCQRRSQSLVSLRRTARVRLSRRVPCGLAGQPCWASASERRRVRLPVRPSPAALLAGPFEHPVSMGKDGFLGAYVFCGLAGQPCWASASDRGKIPPCWMVCRCNLLRSTGRYKRESEAATLRPCWMARLSVIMLQLVGRRYDKLHR